MGVSLVDDGAFASGTRWTASGYQIADNADVQYVGFKNTSDIFATGTIPANIVLHSGVDTPVMTAMDIMVSSYNPYAHAEYYSDTNFVVDFPTWEIFCSGYLTSGVFYSIAEFATGDKSIAQIRNEIYRIVGSQYMIDREKSRQTWEITRFNPF